jgi:copper chaperone
VTTASYTVEGMTCDHCVRAVIAEVEALPGVTGAAVDLPAGSLTVTSETPVDEHAVRDAVTEAGYTVVDRVP